MFFDEAQRYDENEYEWLRDVHDHLDRIRSSCSPSSSARRNCRPMKTAFPAGPQDADRRAPDGRGVALSSAARSVQDVATCLDGYDTTCFPRGTDWSFTRFFCPRRSLRATGWPMTRNCLWDAFEEMHNKKACRRRWRSRWSPSPARWRSCSRKLGLAMRRRIGRRAVVDRPSRRLWLRAGASGDQRIVSEMPDAGVIVGIAERSAVCRS